MKRSLLFTFLFYCTITRLSAQSPFPAIDSINVNNICAAVLVHGDMWWDPATGKPSCEFPTASGRYMNGASALWLSGYDGSGQLHVSAQTYRQTGNDYWPGPLNTSDTLAYDTSQNWAKIWKVSSLDIQYLQSMPVHTIANTPQSILTWPGRGNVNARGNGSVPLTITNDMAPFVDLNGNGIYEPLLGEYPDIKGDQAVWWIFSDNGPAHSQTNGKPLDIEVHAMSYAYKRGTLIDDVVYYNYTIINKSPNTYSDARMALWDDAQLGWYYDDYIGFDSVWRMGVIYSDNNDNGQGGGFPINSYGPDPPMSAVTMIVLPSDTGTNYVPVGSFINYYNDNSIRGNPIVDTQYNNYMRAKLLNGLHFTNDSGQNCNYVFPGDPSDTTQWSECAAHDNAGDRHFVLSSNDFTLFAGSTQKIVFALLVADTARGCPVTSFHDISIVADTAWADYYTPPPQAYDTIIPPPNNTAQANTIQIYPNPVIGQLYVVTNYTSANKSITIYNTLGQKINLPVTSTGTEDIINVSALPTAMYYIVYRKGNLQQTAKFLKE